MSSNEENCPFCQDALCTQETVVIGTKGAESINRASLERGVNIRIEAGTSVHKRCRIRHVDAKHIATSSKTEKSQVKRTRVSLGHYDNKTQCLFCGHDCSNVDPKHPNSEKYTPTYFRVRTDEFVKTVLIHCRTRGDEWARTVQGRIEYFGGDLHAADCIYHQSCSINFRTMRSIPSMFGPTDSVKRSKKGRPNDQEQEEAFEKVCTFLDENYEEQFKISDLTTKMTEYLCDSRSSAYGNQYLREKLLKHYGDSLIITEGRGDHNIVTFRTNTSKILKDFYSTPRANDEESQKRAILITAAKLIKSDIKTSVPLEKESYPTASVLQHSSALGYVPTSLRYFLQNLFVGSDTSKKIASIGHAVIQAVLPRSVIAPLQLGLAIQMHYLYRSRFLVDSLCAMGFSSSYYEVQRFEENSAFSFSQQMMDFELNKNEDVILFAGDNVDHNVITIDGKGSFHGMGMIASITPGKNTHRSIPRHRIEDINLIETAKIDILDYRHTKKHYMQYQISDVS